MVKTKLTKELRDKKVGEKHEKKDKKKDSSTHKTRLLALTGEYTSSFLREPPP